MISLEKEHHYKDDRGENKRLSFYSVPVGDFVWVDGMPHADVVGANSGITVKGCKTYPDGAFAVGHGSNVHHDDNTVLHVYRAECFNNFQEAQTYYNRQVKALDPNTSPTSKLG